MAIRPPVASSENRLRLSRIPTAGKDKEQQQDLPKVFSLYFVKLFTKSVQMIYVKFDELTTIFTDIGGHLSTIVAQLTSDTRIQCIQRPYYRPY